MIERINFKSLVHSFVMLLAIIVLLNIFLGHKNILALYEKKNHIIKIQEELLELNERKDNLKSFLENYNENNQDFIETLIREELNFKGKDEKVFIY